MATRCFEVVSWGALLSPYNELLPEEGASRSIRVGKTDGDERKTPLGGRIDQDGVPVSWILVKVVLAEGFCSALVSKMVSTKS